MRWTGGYAKKHPRIQLIMISLVGESKLAENNCSYKSEALNA